MKGTVTMAQLSVAATALGVAFNCPCCEKGYTQDELRRLLSTAARYQNWEDKGGQGKEPAKPNCRECGTDLRTAIYS